MNKIKKFLLKLAILLLFFSARAKEKGAAKHADCWDTFNLPDSRLQAGRHIDSSHLTIELTCFSITKSDKVKR